MNTDGGVGGTRSARNEHDARPACELAVRLTHVCRTTFLPADDEPQAFARVVERIENREIALSRHAEGKVDTLSDEVVDENPAAGTHESSVEYEEGAAILHAAHGYPGSYNRPGPAPPPEGRETHRWWRRSRCRRRLVSALSRCCSG